MKMIKAILSSKGLPRRGEKGFTLVELLIVLAILAVLAAVVIPNVTGMFGRGAEQAYDTDLKTIQTAAATFFFDVHVYDDGDDEWQDSSGTNGHYYPDMFAGDTYDGTLSLTVNPDDPDSEGNPKVIIAPDGLDATDAMVSAAAIWMGLLVNSPAASSPNDGTTNDFRADAAPLTDEKGPYINEIPDSAMAVITGTIPGNGGATGTYLWIVGENGVVYGIYRAAADEWYSGFSGSYP